VDHHSNGANDHACATCAYVGCESNLIPAYHLIEYLIGQHGPAAAAAAADLLFVLFVATSFC
jgi:hypothetical protein